MGGKPDIEFSLGTTRSIEHSRVCAGQHSGSFRLLTPSTHSPTLWDSSMIWFLINRSDAHFFNRYLPCFRCGNNATITRESHAIEMVGEP